MKQWYVEEDLGGYVLRGYVSGHRRLADGRFIRSSRICECKKLDHVYMFRTYQTKYYCKFNECDFANCVTASFLEDFAMVKETYMAKGE